MSSIIRLRRGVIAVVLLASGPAHAGPTRLPPPPYPRPDGERHLRRSRSVQRLLCNAYSASQFSSPKSRSIESFPPHAPIASVCRRGRQMTWRRLSIPSFLLSLHDRSVPSG